jgi:hypothetical protein
MKPSSPMLLAFLLPLALAGTARAQEPPPAAPQGVFPAAPAPPPAAPAPAQPAPVLALASAAPTTALPAPPSPLLERRSEGLRTAGIVLIPLASIALVSGVFVTTVGALSPPCSCDSPTGLSGATRVGLGFMGAGALALTGGIVMAVVGSKKVPVRAHEALAPAPSWAAEPLVGAGTAGVKIRF